MELICCGAPSPHLRADRNSRNGGHGESHASSIIFTVRNRLNRNWVFSNDWKAHAMKENKHPWKQEHTHKFRIHIQFWVAKFSNRFSPFPSLEAPPKKHPVFLSLPPSTNTSMEPFFNAMVTFSQFDHWKVPRISRMVDSLVDLWQFRCASRATLSWKNPMKSHKTGPLWASNLPKKTWCQLTKVWIFSSLHLWLPCVWVVIWAWASMRWPGLVRPALKSTFPMPAWWSNFWSKVSLQKFAGGCECDWKSCNPWRTVGGGKFKNLCPKSLCSSEGRMTSWNDVPQTGLISYQIL